MKMKVWTGCPLDFLSTVSHHMLNISLIPPPPPAIEDDVDFSFEASPTSPFAQWVGLQPEDENVGRPFGNFETALRDFLHVQQVSHSEFKTLGTSFFLSFHVENHTMGNNTILSPCFLLHDPLRDPLHQSLPVVTRPQMSPRHQLGTERFEGLFLL